MKIAQIAPIVYSIPPQKYGGSERVIHALTEELVKMGHDVTLFATGDSVTSGKLVSIVEKGLGEINGQDPFASNAITTMHYGLAYQMQDQFDIIHDHLNNISLATANLAHTPVVVSMHGPFLDELQELYATLNKPHVVTISDRQFQMSPRGMNHAGTVYHGLKMDHYPFSANPKKYLLFVGRITREKGIHYAIEVAERLDLPLIIAAKLEPNFKADVDYFEQKIKPHLSDKIRWIGPVDDEERNKLMSKALCFLHPVTWPEPFGLVLIESMVCGTPVVAMNQGSIPEIIEDGKTGFVVRTIDEMTEAVKKIDSISRAYCRQYALSYFSARRMAEDYIRVYKKILQKEKTLYGSSQASDFLGKVIKHPYHASRKIVAYAQDIKQDLKMISVKPKLTLELDD